MCIKMRQPGKIQAEGSKFVSVSAQTTSGSAWMCHSSSAAAVWSYTGFSLALHPPLKEASLAPSEVSVALQDTWVTQELWTCGLCALRVLQLVCTSSCSAPLLEPSRRRERAGGAHLGQNLLSPQPPWTPGHIVTFPLRKHHGWCQSFLAPKSFFCNHLQVREIEAGFFLVGYSCCWVSAVAVISWMLSGSINHFWCWKKLSTLPLPPATCCHPTPPLPWCLEESFVWSLEEQVMLKPGKTKKGW